MRTYLKEEIGLTNKILSMFDKGAYVMEIDKEIWCEEREQNKTKEYHICLKPAEWWKKGDAIALASGKSIGEALSNLLKKLEEL